MYCQHCNHMLDDSATFCPACGKPVQARSAGGPVRYFTSAKILMTISLISIIFCVALAVGTGVTYMNRSYLMSSETEMILLMLTILAPLCALIDVYQMAMRSKIQVRADENGLSGMWPGAMLGSSILSVEPFQISYAEIERVELKNGRFRIQVRGSWKSMMLDSAQDLKTLIDSKKVSC